LRLPIRRRKSSVPAAGRAAFACPDETASEQYARADAADLLRDRLEQALREARTRGLTHHDALRVAMAWAAHEAYATGGYPQARALSLEALEGVLLLDAVKAKKDAA
jgi:hypothetical protein